MSNIYRDNIGEIPVLALSVQEAARSIGISPRLLQQLTLEGQVPCVYLGKRRTVYPIESLRQWLNDMATKRRQVTPPPLPALPPPIQRLYDAESALPAVDAN
jgi:hypothetical protein